MLSLFWKMILAHMLADFTLQTNALYALKIEGLTGQILHGAILFFISAILAIPYLNYPVIWIYLLAITYIHITQDFIKTKYLKDSLLPFWPFIIDQLIHFLSVAAIFIFPLPQPKPVPDSANLFFRLYNDERIVYLLIGYIFATWQGAFFIDTFNRTFLKNIRLSGNTPRRYFIPAQEKYYGIIERAALTTLSFFGGGFYLLIPLVGGMRFLFKNLRSRPISLLGILLSIITGTVLRIVIRN